MYIRVTQRENISGHIILARQAYSGLPVTEGSAFPLRLLGFHHGAVTAKEAIID